MCWPHVFGTTREVDLEISKLIEIEPGLRQLASDGREGSLGEADAQFAGVGTGAGNGIGEQRRGR